MMVDQGAPGPIDDHTPLSERIEAVEEFAEIAARLVTVGELKWADVETDYRILAINSALRQQLEGLRAAIVLAHQDLGHLAVAFVRASLENVMYLGFFVSLGRNESQKLFLLFGSWDFTRSLLAQRAYVGDEAMATLWYPKEFLDGVQRKREEIRAELKEIEKQYKWQGRLLPSGAWIAEQAGQKELYEYLHAATSRSLHFSAGEIMRRGWGHPSGVMITDKPEFREHLTAFALDQLWRLLVKTWEITAEFMDASGISSDERLTFDELNPTLDRLLAAGKVPLVHAAEWNLTPQGPLARP